MAAAFGAVLGTTTTGGAEATTVTVSTSASVPAGGRVGLVVAFYNNVTASASGGGLSWANDGVAQNTGDTNYRIGFLSADAPSGLASSTTLTVTFSGSGAFSRMLSCFYLTGVASASYQDGSVVAGSGTNGPWTTSSLTTGNADDILIGGCWKDFDLVSNTKDTNWTEIHDFQDVAASSSMITQYRVVSSTGSYPSLGDWGGAASGTAWTAGMVAYKAAAAAAADIPVLVMAPPIPT